MKRALSLARCLRALAAVAYALGAVAWGASLGTWKQAPSGTALDFSAVAFGNETFVAVGDKGLIMTSADGVKWTKRSAGINRLFNDVTFSNGRFIAVCKAPQTGSGAKIFVSDSNGAGWKYRDTDAGGDTIPFGMHAVAGDGNGTLVAVGGFGWVTRSHDNGQTWHAIGTRFTTASLYGVAWGKGVWVATGPSGVFRSTDTDTWTAAAETFPAFKLAYGNNRFVATSNDSGAAFRSSVDGNKWGLCARAPGFTGDGWPSYSDAVAFGDGMFTVTGDNGDLWTSETGLLWKRWTSPAPSIGLPGVAFGQRKFVAVGYNGRIVASPPWMKARLGSTWDYPFTLFDTEDGKPRRIGLPEYRVNTASLNLVLEATLFYMPTLGVPVNVRLVYSSQPTEDGADTIGLFGKNWRFRYESVIGQFGPEAQMITGGGRSVVWGTPKGEDLATATLGVPITLVPPTGVFDELKFYGPGNYFEMKEKDTKLTYRYAVAGGPGNAIWRLTRITDRSGNQVNLAVTGANGRINSITDAAGRVVNFTYNLDSLCTGISMPAGRTVSFTYDTHKNLVGITDMAGYAGTYTYDKKGFLLRMDTAGRVNSFTYMDRPGYEADSTPPDGEGSGDRCLASVTNAQGQVVKYELLPKDGGVKRTDARGNVTTFKSSTGQTAKTVDPLGAVREMQYNDAKLPGSFTDEAGNVTKFDYDARGNLTTTTDALGAVTTFVPDARNNLSSRTNALGKTWTYTYDGSDRVLTARSPLGNTTTFAYYGNGRINTVRDPLNHTTTYTYDAYGNLKSVADATSHQTQFGYDAAGLRCTSMVDARGKTKTMTYDGNDRLLTVTQNSAPGAPQRINTMDAFGVYRFEDEMHQVTRMMRNDFGFITSTEDPLGNVSATEYDPDNNPVKLVDLLGRVTTFTYDDANRPLVFTDALGKKVTRAYDDVGNLVSLTDKGGATTTFAYDENRRLTGTTDPLGRTVALTRDALGRITGQTNARGQQVLFTFDDDDRVTAKRYQEPSGSPQAEASYGYDAAGNLTQMVDRWGTTDLTYDAANRPLTVTYPNVGGSRKAASFTYAPGGMIGSITYPNGLVVTYTYDNFNRVPIPERFRRKGGVELAGMNEKPNLVTSLVMSLGGSTRTIDYGYDAAARLISISRVGGNNSALAYDAVGRMTALRHFMGAATHYESHISTDAAGNTLAEEITGDAVLEPALPSAISASYNKANQLVAWDGKAFTYDKDGNLTSISGGEFTATYTPENKPLTIDRPSGVTTYLYDGHGMRVRRVTAGVGMFNYHYSPGGRLLFTTDSSGAVTATYIWAGRTLAAILTGPTLTGDLHFAHLDRMGNVVLLTGPAGAVEKKYAYQPHGTPFRETVPPGLPDANLFTYIGGVGVIDDGEGLFCMTNRFYDATTGRFLQRDPIGVNGDINLYRYAASNPVGFIDPMGTEEFDPQEPATNTGEGTYDVVNNTPPVYGDTSFDESTADYIKATAWNWTPGSGIVEGLGKLDTKPGEAVVDITLDLMGPVGDAIGQVILTVEAVRKPELEAQEQREREQAKAEFEAYREAYKETVRRNEEMNQMMNRFFPGTNR